MKKPGFLKRIFSFGRKKQDESTDETQSSIVSNNESPVIERSSEPHHSKIQSAVEPDEDAATISNNDSPPKQSELDVDDKVELEIDTEIVEAKVIEQHSQHEERPISLEEKLKESTTSMTEPDEEKAPVEAIGVEQPRLRGDSTMDNLSDTEIPDSPGATNSQPETVVSTPEKPEADTPDKQHHITVKPATPAKAEDLPDADEKPSWFKRLSQGLSRTSSQLSENIAAVFTKKKLDDDALEELEDILIQADLGVETAMNIVDSLAKQRMGKDVTDEEVRTIMSEQIESVLEPVAKPLELDLDHKPHVILVVGVNGSGKTTTIGKLSQKLRDGGYSSMLVAGDTFRAAAIEQLKIWGERTNAPVFSRSLGSDSSGLAFDAWQAARNDGFDVMMMDTAGRLQNKSELMEELEKIVRVLKKQDPTAPHTVLLTLDATTGQNALNQVEIFGKVAGVNGLIMTKLDGSARGGILVAISAKFKLPVYFVGVGEQVEDLEPFEAREFARTIAGLNI